MLSSAWAANLIFILLNHIRRNLGCHPRHISIHFRVNIGILNNNSVDCNRYAAPPRLAFGSAAFTAGAAGFLLYFCLNLRFYF